MRTFTIEDFSGGWNVRDAWSEIADNELPDAINVSPDERGGLVKRLGLTKYNSAQVGADAFENIFYSAALGLIIAQQGTQLYRSTPGSGTFAAFGAALGNSSRCVFADFVGKLVVGNTEGARSYDGTTLTALIANSPPIKTMAVWQNAIWSGGDSANPTRVTRSDLGAITWNVSPPTVDFRYKDDKPVTAVGGGAGMDVSGRSGLLVFKEDSSYRIHDSSTGANTAVDFTYGAGGPLAVTTNEGITAAISRRGIIAMRGDDTVPTLVSQKIEPLFQSTQMNHDKLDNLVATNFQDRMVFSLARVGSTANNLALEFHPTLGWIVPHGFGLACGSTVLKTGASTAAEKLYGGAAASGFAYDVFTGGSDDGSNIACRFQTRWFEPFRGSESRYRRLLVNGRGSFQLYWRQDYDTGQGDLHTVSITGTGAKWGTALWGTDTWGTDLFQDYDRFYSLGHGRAFSLEVQETSSLTTVGPKLLDDGSAETLGAIAVYGFAVDIQSLGFS